MVTIYFNRKIVCLICDHGGEYVSQNRQIFFQEKEIWLEMMVSYTLKKNGHAEQLNRTFIEKGRAMLLDSNLRKDMLGEAICAAAYLFNHFPTSAVEEKTTIKIRFIKSQVSSVRIFGTVAWAEIPKVEREKIDPKTDTFIMVGYSKHGYWLLSLTGLIKKLESMIAKETDVELKNQNVLLEIEDLNIWTITIQHHPVFWHF